MPSYTFELRDGECPIETDVELPDREDAAAYGREVVRELMSSREEETRGWCLQIYEQGKLVCEIPFASVDRTLDHLRPDLRATVERWCQARRSLKEAAYAARMTMRESRALVARSRGKPYLAAERGKRTIRRTG
jgi:hypothetical protein